VPETKPAIDLDRKAKESPVAAAARKDLVGLAVFGSDGQKVGDVQAVKVEAGGPIQEIHVRTGGFLGFGGRMVAIPAGKFSKSGQSVQLAMTSTEVKALPDLKARAS
jgi:sporulation protein YlmC with PRC-barrel domain